MAVYGPPFSQTGKRQLSLKFSLGTCTPDWNRPEKQLPAILEARPESLASLQAAGHYLPSPCSCFYYMPNSRSNPCLKKKMEY